MVKITMIGAGSAGFCRTLVQDILCFDCLKDSHIFLMDVDPSRLAITHSVMSNMVAQHKLTCRFSATTDLREALVGADFAISMIQVGGLEPFKIDISIPLKYGVDQCVGDTVGPGGIFRGLRHVPALLEILRMMEDVCPNVVFMNYANPMAICSWAMQKAYPHIQSIGLCHGVQHTTNMLCDWVGVEPEDCDIVTAGINHMAWFLKFMCKGRDLYLDFWHKLGTDGPIKGEEYRFEMMKAAGYFMTESSGHLSEYLPYFRKRRDLQDLFGGPGFSGETAAYLNMCLEYLQEYNKEMADMAQGRKAVPFEAGKKSVEYAADIMNACITDKPFCFAGNVLNKGFITNLPNDCCVEVPVYTDRNGLHGSFVGPLPKQCAALCQTNISVQDLAVEAALYGDMEAAYHACLMDPLTAAVLAPHEIRNMVDEMFELQMPWLQQFKGKKNIAPGFRVGRIATGALTIKAGRKLNHIIGHYDRM
jgi:alpha-galactosidase